MLLCFTTLHILIISILLTVQYGNGRTSHLWREFKQRNILISCLLIHVMLLLCPNFCFCAIWACLGSLTNALSNVLRSQIGNLRHASPISASLIVISHQVTGCRCVCDFWPLSKDKSKWSLTGGGSLFFPPRGCIVSFPADCTDILGHLSYVGQAWCRGGRVHGSRGGSTTGHSQPSELKVCQSPSQPADIAVGSMPVLFLIFLCNAKKLYTSYKMEEKKNQSILKSSFELENRRSHSLQVLLGKPARGRNSLERNKTLLRFRLRSFLRLTVIPDKMFNLLEGQSLNMNVSGTTACQLYSSIPSWSVKFRHSHKQALASTLSHGQTATANIVPQHRPKISQLGARLLKHCHLVYITHCLFLSRRQPDSNKAERFDYVSQKKFPMLHNL